MFTPSKYFVLAVFLHFNNARVIFYFNLALKIGSLIFSVTEPFVLNFGVLLAKKIIQSLCCFRFKSERLLIFSQIYFLPESCLVREQRFYCFRKFLFIQNIFLIQVFVILFFSLFLERHAFIPLLYIKLTGFSYFF